MNQPIRPSLHALNVLNMQKYGTATAQSFANGKNPHAVALGKMTSEAKARAAQDNGEKGGRPKGS